jgi:hypothetical protein
MDRVEAFTRVAADAQRGATLEELMPVACDLCQELLPDPVWEQVRVIDWATSSAQSREWLAALLGAEPPGKSITGFWFGIFNPIYADPPPSVADLSKVATSDFYIQGSATYPEDDWVFDRSWLPDGRYAHSHAQNQIYRIAAGSVGDEVLRIADYVLTFAHASGTVNSLIDRIDRKLTLGPAPVRAVAVGHDSGDAIFLGVVGRAGIDRTKAGWI